MLKITLENGSAYEVLPETACYPSMSTTARGHLEIHMSADAMTLDEFYALMTDAEATKKITLQNIDAETVSYTHLDVYKRQGLRQRAREAGAGAAKRARRAAGGAVRRGQRHDGGAVSAICKPGL